MPFNLNTLILLSLLCLNSVALAQVEDFEMDDLEEPAAASEFEAPRNEPLPVIPKKSAIDPMAPREGSRFIQHPNAAKGLIKITKDKTYIYKVDRSDQKRAASLRFGVFDPLELQNPDTGSSFDDNYSETENPIILFDYEWQLWHSPIGKWGINAGTGFYIANGNGRFANPAETRSPREGFTFIAMPLTGGATYRMQLWDKQPLVPYASGGANLFGFSEVRDDGQGPKFGGALGAYAAAGVGLNMTHWNELSMIALDREYGINGVFLTLEFRKIIGFGNFDFTSDVINGGMSVEF